MLSTWCFYVTRRVLTKFPKDKKLGQKEITTFSMGNFALPGEKTFGLGGFFAVPKDRSESGTFIFCVISSCTSSAHGVFKIIRVDFSFLQICFVGTSVNCVKKLQNVFWKRFTMLTEQPTSIGLPLARKSSWYVLFYFSFWLCLS